MFIDFGVLKESVTILQVASMLSLHVHANGEIVRATCPTCTTDRALALNTTTNTFYCFKARLGGDVIALTAHVLGVSMKEAAQFILNHIEERHDTITSLDYLISDHVEVQALGLSTSKAQEIGAGYAKKGIMRGHVAIPLRTTDGTLIGYLGIPPKTPIKLPKNLETTDGNRTEGN